MEERFPPSLPALDALGKQPAGAGIRLGQRPLMGGPSAR